MGMLDNNEKLLAGVENASVEIGYGFTGWIEHRRVLLGSREMMKRHDIEVPSLDYEKKYTKNDQRSPIYLAVAASCSACSSSATGPDRRAAETLTVWRRAVSACWYRQTISTLPRRWWPRLTGIPEGTVKVLSQHEQDALETELAYRPESEGVMMHTGACASFLGGMPRGRARGRRRTPCGRCADGRCGAGCGAQCGVGLLRGPYGPFSGTVLAYQLVWCAIIASVPFAKKP